MMDYSDTYWSAKADNEIVKELGRYIKKRRLALNFTQQDVADKAGVNRSTISQLEGGSSVNLITFIQVLRTLDQLSLLDGFKPSNEISPMLLAEADKKARQRATGSKKDSPPSYEW